MESRLKFFISSATERLSLPTNPYAGFARRVCCCLLLSSWSGLEQHSPSRRRSVSVEPWVVLSTRQCADEYVISGHWVPSYHSPLGPCQDAAHSPTFIYDRGVVHPWWTHCLSFCEPCFYATAVTSLLTLFVDDGVCRWHTLTCSFTCYVVVVMYLYSDQFFHPCTRLQML